MPTVSGPVSGTSLTAPLSAVECVWFKVRVDSWQAHKDLHHRDTVYFSRSAEPFFIGDVPVSPSLAEGTVSVTETFTGKRPPSAEETPLLHLLASRGLIDPKALHRRAHLLDEIVWETTEYVLTPGTALTVRGRRSRSGLLKPSLFAR
ncbi:hypothetical protein [Catelliglobosispora koreensis]|uniref:hypothetical protein n=1 Tax=Catelliglobosispora koreensis TaxID=129052 RepID=UPI0003686B47|nr:hypothetical protein [Catelliglobosispora koreensis]